MWSVIGNSRNLCATPCFLRLHFIIDLNEGRMEAHLPGLLENIVEADI